MTAVIAAWPLGGLYLDGWAHKNRPNLETFFTPWHAVFYSGFLAIATWVLLIVYRNHRKGYAWRDAPPQGYGLGVIGLGMFAVGAVGDAFWHTIFGVEHGLNTLLSPTHLVLLGGALLGVLSPFRSAWSSTDEDLGLAPLLSMTFMTAALVFFFGFATLFNQDWTAFDDAAFVRGFQAQGVADAGTLQSLAEHVQVRGIAAALFTSLIVLGPVLLMLRRWRVPFGAVTFLFMTMAVLSGAIVNFSLWEKLIAAEVAGLAADVLIQAARPGPDRLSAHRAVATAIPTLLIGLMFLTTTLRHGNGWPPELLGGTIFFGALGGFALSYLMLPPLPARPISREES